MPATAATRRLAVEVGFSAREVITGTRDVTNRIRTMARDISESFKGAQAGFDHFTNNLQTLTNAATGAFDQLREGARRIELREAFEQQLGGSAQVTERWLNTLNDAAGGTITEFGLISSASKAMSLGVTSNLSEMEQLLEIARFKARKFGTDTAVAFEDISIGVGRQSKLILDNLGIVVDTDQAYREYAESIGVAANQLDETQQKQAFLNAVLREGADEIQRAGGLIDSEADKLRILQVEWDKAIGAAQRYASLTVGRQITNNEGENQVDQFFQQAAQYDLVAAATARARQELTEWYEANDSVLLRVNQTVGSYEQLRNVLDNNADAQREFRRYLLDNYEAFNVTRQQAELLAFGYVQLTDATIDANYGLTQLTGTTQETSNAQIEGVNASGAFTNALNFVAGAVSATANAMPVLRAEAEYLKNAFTGVAVAAAASAEIMEQTFGASYDRFQALQNKAGNNNPLFRFGGRGGDFGGGTGLRGGIQDIFADIETDFQASLRSGIGGGARSGVSAAEKELKRLEREAEQSARAIEQDLNSALSSAFDLSINVTRNQSLQAAAGIYGEQFNEAGRQLEDIINRGAESPFAVRYFEALIGDETQLKAAAAKLQDDIAAGLRVDLLNYDVLLQNAENNLIANRNREELFARARQDLIARGYGASEIAEALGTEAVSAGADAGAALATNISESLQAGIEAEQARFRAMGELGAQYFEGGFNQGLRGIVRRMLEQELDAMTQEIAA